MNHIEGSRTAANNVMVGDQIIEFLLREWGNDIVIPEIVPEAACSNDKNGEQITETIVQIPNHILPKNVTKERDKSNSEK